MLHQRSGSGLPATSGRQQVLELLCVAADAQNVRADLKLQVTLRSPISLIFQSWQTPSNAASSLDLSSLLLALL